MGNDSIYNYGNQISLNGGEGNDTLIGDYSNATILGNAGADFISITTYWRNTLSGGAGNDTILAGGVQHSVNGGAGADRISLTGGELTIKGGTGNDSIYGNTTTSHLYQYAKGDGKDIIYNWSANDTLQITNGSYSTVKSGSKDISVKVDKGSILLKGAQGKKVKIVGKKTINPAPDDDSATQLEVIKKFMKSLDTTTQAGRSALNEAVNVATSGHFYSIDILIKQMIADLRNSKNGNEFLLNYCGIDLSNNDTGAITGKDAGGKNILTPTGVVPEVGDMDTSFNKTVLETKKGVTFRLIKSNLSYDENHIWQAIKTWWANEGLGLIENSYDYSFSDSDVTIETSP